MANFLAPIINDQQEDANGAPLSGGVIEVYLAGSSTPATTYSDQEGDANTWPIVLNTLGVNNQGAVWLTGGAAYKFVIKSATGIVQRTIDNVSGVNDTAVAADQWVVYQGTPTYVSATSFTVEGDQTSIFQTGRRLRTENTGGTVYSTIVSSAYSAPNTTVTVLNTSGDLDAGLSMVSYGLVSIVDSSVSGLLLGARVISVTGTYTATPGTTFVVVEGVGGGGAGGGVPAAGGGAQAAGGGGGAGAYGLLVIKEGFSGVTATIGAAGAAAVGGSGGAGGNTSFGSLLTLNGGAGGNVGVVGTTVSGLPGAGGTITGGTTYGNPGASGGLGLTFTGVAISGAGASTKFGAGAGVVASSSTASTVGNPGFIGAGGSGAIGINNGAAAAGGVGGSGLIVVWEYA